MVHGSSSSHSLSFTIVSSSVFSLSDFSSSLPGFTDDSMKIISPPSHSENLNDPPLRHSRPPRSVLSSSAPRPSTATPPTCDARRFSNSRSRIVVTREIARPEPVRDLLCVREVEGAEWSRSDLWASIARGGRELVGGSETRAWRISCRCLKKSQLIYTMR